MSTSVFISHTATDKEVVDAFGQLVKSLLGDHIDLKYSSDPEHGPRHGDQWLTWIHQQVRNSIFTIVMITPASVNKPWILWEAGAVAGTTISSGAVDARKVRPLIFRLLPEQVPDPFKDTHVLRGDQYEAMYSMLEDWITSILRDQPVAVAKSIPRLPAALRDYLALVQTALDNAPLLPTEAVVQEWTLRLDELKRQNRTSEVKNLHEWLNIAFRRKQEDKPLDIRLHRRLGELYLNSQDYHAAAVQLELARQVSPRDLFVLRGLGRAYQGLKADDKVLAIIEAIQKLDSEAFTRSAECAALKGRWHRDRKDFEGAREVYRQAFLRNPKSYYLGELLGQIQLQLGEVDAATATYGQVLEIINSLSEQNLWTQAAAANAAIVSRASATVVTEKLRQIRNYNPLPESIRSIEDGLARLKESMGVDDTVFGEWLAALRT